MTYLFENLRTEARKNWETIFEFWGRAQWSLNRWVLMEIFFGIKHFYIK
jgi:hypothetical protein